MTDLKQLFKTAVASSMDLRGKPAVLGKVDGTLYWSSSRRDMVWARIGENASFQEMVVHCTKVTPQYDMPVRVDLVNGIMSVVAVDEKRYLEFSGNRPGGNVGAHAWLHGRLGPDPLYITGLQYLPLLVVPSNPPGMTVTVKQGAYRWDGVYKILEETISGSLSAYIPGSASVKHFVIICLDRVNNTIVIVDGDDLTGGGDALFGGIVLTNADILAITNGIDISYVPLAAIVLYNGQTEVRAADITMDLRAWGGGAGTSATFTEPDDDGETYGRMTDTGVSSWVAVVPASGGTYTGTVSISQGAASDWLVLNAESDSSIASIQFKRGGSLRWSIVQESTTFDNNDFSITRYDNSGIVIDEPLHINRSSGVITASAGAVINGGVVFNESGADVDHRLEGDTDVNLTYWDAGNNRVGIGTASPTDKLHVVGSTSLDGAVVFNETGADVDFRFETDTDANALVIDGGLNSIGMGTNTPIAFLHLAKTVTDTTPITGAYIHNTFAPSSAPGVVFPRALTLQADYNSTHSPSGGFQLAQFLNVRNVGNGTISTRCLDVAYSNLGNGTVTFSTGVNIRAPVNSGGGAITTAYGIKVENQNVAGTNYAIYTDAGIVRIGDGITVGSPTGGYKGSGTVNAQALYDDNTLLSDHILDLHYDGRMRPADAERYPDARLWNIEQTAVFTEKNRHLPTMPGRAEWEADGSRSLGQLVTALWETVEQQQLQIFELNNRLQAVKNGEGN